MEPCRPSGWKLDEEDGRLSADERESGSDDEDRKLLVPSGVPVDGNLVARTRAGDGATLAAGFKLAVEALEVVRRVDGTGSAGVLDVVLLLLIGVLVPLSALPLAFFCINI